MTVHSVVIWETCSTDTTEVATSGYNEIWDAEIGEQTSTVKHHSGGLSLA
jgi:hypothetical protein